MPPPPESNHPPEVTAPEEAWQAPAAVVEALLQTGVQEFVLCAGARNSALLVLLAAVPNLRLWHHFEERSAAFFALGRVLALSRPVAVVTTSGTAAAELYPAVIEARYSGLPLVALTADRPVNCRGSGAPQAIEQAGLYGSYPGLAVDITGPGDLTGLCRLQHWDGCSPLHINLCLEEPAAADLEPLRQAGLSLEDKASPHRPEVSGPHAYPTVSGSGIDWSEYPDPLILVGDLLPQEQDAVRNFVMAVGAPVYAEAASGLRECAVLALQRVPGGEAGLTHCRHRSVIRLGGVPVCRFWRDLAEQHTVPVLNFTRSGYRGMARTCRTRSLKELHAISPPPARTHRTARDARQDPLNPLLARFPRSEPALIHRLSLAIPKPSMVFTGNSLAIREWNLCAAPDHPIHARALRGANGIDGNLSAFLGLAADSPEAWCLTGDLTALYDASAPWILNQISRPKVRFVIIQNGGGKIFSLLPALEGLRQEERTLMENPHQTGLSGWAAQWNLDCLDWETLEQTRSQIPDRVVISLQPDEVQTREFWVEWRRVVQSWNHSDPFLDLPASRTVSPEPGAGGAAE